MPQACVTTKIYVSGEPIDLSNYDVYALTPSGNPLHVQSWKQLPEAEVPAIAVPKGDLPPAAVHFNPDIYTPASWIRGSVSGKSAKGSAGRNSHRIHPELETLPTDDRTRAALSQIVERPPQGHGLLISSPYGGGSREAARALAYLLAPRDSVFEAAPNADRWTVEEVDDMVARPAYMKSPSGVRPVIVVEDVDAMPGSVADRMLKILEEPPGGALFILTTADPDRLRPALRGRMAGHVPVAPLSSPDRRISYEEAGLSKAAAKTVDELAGSNVSLGLSLARAAAKDPELIERAASALSAEDRDTASPVRSAVAAASSLEALAKVVAAHAPKTDEPVPPQQPETEDLSDDHSEEEAPSSPVKTQDREMKATERMLARHLIDRVVADLRDRYLYQPVTEGNVGAVPASKLLTAIRTAARDAKAGVNAYIPTERVLTAFYVRLSELGL